MDQVGGAVHTAEADEHVPPVDFLILAIGARDVEAAAALCMGEEMGGLGGEAVGKKGGRWRWRWWWRDSEKSWG